MRHNGFSARLMQTPRLKDVGRAYGLPPGNPVPVYPIDALPGCPEDWIHGSGSYICPVDEYALWFDWTMNDNENTAVIASVKGMNPITGRKLEGLALEKYSEKCPVHNIPFSGDKLFCKECGYKWPAQSYVSYPNTLWWDGFRQADGTVRQFFFTDDEERDVASAIIGKKNTVPAFGFVFYEPKVRRVTKLARGRGIGGSSIMSFAGFYDSKGTGKKYLNGGPSGQSVISNYAEISMKHTEDGPNQVYCSNVLRSKSTMDFADQEDCEEKTSSIILPSEEKDVSVGAGAEINQDLRPDNTPLTDWKEEPSSIIRLYFVFRKKFEKIVAKGLVDLDGNKEGYLKGLPVG